MRVAIGEEFFMRAAKRDDTEAVAELLNAHSMAVNGMKSHAPEDLRIDWQRPDLDLQTDTRLLIAPDGYGVGWGVVRDREPHVRLQTWTCVHPDYHGQGLGAWLLDWAERRARQAIPGAPEGARVTLRHSAVGTDEATRERLHNAGFAPVRHIWQMQIDMDAAPPDPTWPDGITMRTLVPGQDERPALVAVREAFRDHWGYVEMPFEQDYAQWMCWLHNNDGFDPTLGFLAVDGDEIAGVAFCTHRTREDPDRGWVNVLGVRQPWRRRGIALALLRHALGEFYRRGQRSVGLGVDVGNLTGATRLYEQAGMRVVRRYESYEKELRPGDELATP